MASPADCDRNSPIGQSSDRACSESLTIVSGGQTGADRAALDFAIAHDLAHDGWCPRGRLAEDGKIDALYHLRETPTRRYAERTEWNVRDSDATVVFRSASGARGGTALTIALAKRLAKALFEIADDEDPAAAGAELREFIRARSIRRLNIAGPRASQAPAIARFVEQVLTEALASPASTARVAQLAARRATSGR